MAIEDNILASAPNDIEKLITDLRDLIDSKDLDAVPQIKQLRRRFEDGLQTARESTVVAAQDAARQAREAARVANEYAHDEPWRVAGGALAVGVLLGFVLTRR